MYFSAVLFPNNSVIMTVLQHCDIFPASDLNEDTVFGTVLLPVEVQCYMCIYCIYSNKMQLWAVGSVTVLWGHLLGGYETACRDRKTWMPCLRSGREIFDNPNSVLTGCAPLCLRQSVLLHLRLLIWRLREDCLLFSSSDSADYFLDYRLIVLCIKCHEMEKNICSNFPNLSRCLFEMSFFCPTMSSKKYNHRRQTSDFLLNTLIVSHTAFWKHFWKS